VQYANGPDRFEYRLTDAGLELFGAIVILMRWGDTHLAGPEGPPIVLTHDVCGQVTRPQLMCDVCGEQVTARNVTPAPGPGFLEVEPPAREANGRRVRR